MIFSSRTNLTLALLILSGAILSCAGKWGVSLVFAQATTPPKASAAAAKPAPVDEYDRVAQLWYYQRMGKSGWERGQEIYKMKCWICHNDYTIKAQPDAAPTLKGLFQRPLLRTGQPVNDETVAAQIRNGNSRMAAYGHVLNEQDIADLVTYLREKCCWDEMNPPANPRYHP
jgi:mono/diheme cytochrome c family protein